MLVKIENWMRYSYEEPVSFSTHAIRLYPRADQAITTHQLQTTINIDSDIQYRRDIFDNIVANCFLPRPSKVLEFRVALEIELWPRNPFHFLLAPHALHLPFEYTPEESRVLAPFRAIGPDEGVDAGEIWQLTGKLNMRFERKAKRDRLPRRSNCDRVPVGIRPFFARPFCARSVWPSEL